MLFQSILTGLTLAASAVEARPSHHKIRASTTITTFSNNVFYTPGANYTDPEVLYARSLELSDGTLLATWENYSPEPPLVYFPIYESKDSGVTWTEIAKVEDQVNGWGLRYQPFIYELPSDFGDYPAGTVLLAGNSIPTDLSLTRIDVYASTDKGYTWEFVSNVADGGEALPNNGLTPIWEPFLMLYNNQLVCYYSDQRDPAAGQKLVHQTTSDLKTWDAVVNDVIHPTYTDRPGMPVIAQLSDGNYLLTYEWGGGAINNSTASYSFPVYYRISADPLEFDSAADHPLVPVNTGTIPVSSPYVVYSTAVGGENGTIVVSDGTHSSVFTNQALGAEDAWIEWATPQPKAYTRDLRIFKEDETKLIIMGAGHLPPSTTNNVSLSVVDLPSLLLQ